MGVPDEVHRVRAPLVRREGVSATFCVNPACPAQQWAGICHFVSRGAMDIEGLGERTVSTVPATKACSPTRATCSSSTTTRSVTIEGFGDISVDNLRTSVDAARDRPLANLLFGLGHQARRRLRCAAALAKGLGHLDAIAAATVDEIAALDGVGTVIAESVVTWFAEPGNQALIEKLRAGGRELRWARPRPTCRKRSSGMSIVVTGTLEGFTRESAEEAILARGGKSPGQRVEEDDRGRRGRRARRGEVHQGAGARRADPRRSRFRAPARNRRTA